MLQSEKTTQLEGVRRGSTMFRSNPGVRRPALYVFAALLGIALVLPLAISSGQTGAEGIFDECFAASCSANTLVADAG